MPKRNGLTSSSILANKALQLVNGVVSGNDLVLTKENGSTVNVGAVKGATGSAGVAPVFYSSASLAVTSIANNTMTAVDGWAFVEGTSTLFTQSTTNFTATQAGLYHIIFTATLGSNSVGRRLVTIYVGASEKRRIEHFAGAGPWTGLVETKVMLAVGNVLTFRVYQGSGAALALSATPGHDVTIIKLA